MRILVTNDDGMNSPGLRSIAQALGKDHEVWVVAPESERSAMSHYITIRDPVILKEVARRSFTSSGSPADCVIMGVLGGIPVEPENSTSYRDRSDDLTA